MVPEIETFYPKMKYEVFVLNLGSDRKPRADQLLLNLGARGRKRLGEMRDLSPKHAWFLGIAGVIAHT